VTFTSNYHVKLNLKDSWYFFWCTLVGHLCIHICKILFCRQIKGHVEQMSLNLSSCGDDMLQFRRCLAASFFLNAAVKQPEGTYRYLIQVRNYWLSCLCGLLSIPSCNQTLVL